VRAVIAYQCSSLTIKGRNTIILSIYMRCDVMMPLYPVSEIWCFPHCTSQDCTEPLLCLFCMYMYIPLLVSLTQSAGHIARPSIEVIWSSTIIIRTERVVRTFLAMLNIMNYSNFPLNPCIVVFKLLKYVHSFVLFTIAKLPSLLTYYLYTTHLTSQKFNHCLFSMITD